MKEEGIKAEGTVIESAHDIFRVRLDDRPDHIVDAKPSGKMRTQHIRILDGDKVVVEISPYDLKRGRIVYRKLSNAPRSTT